MGKRTYLITLTAIIGLAWFHFSKDAEAMVSGSGRTESQNLACGETTRRDPSCLEIEQRILSTTLRIEIRTWIIYVEGQGYATLFSGGHGTVMDGRHLLTHNHFQLPLLELLADDVDGEFATVTLYTADGTVLWQGPLTTAAVVFDDSETLLLEFLDRDGRGLFESLGVPSADFKSGKESSVAAGSTIAQINWDQSRAYIQWTKVKAVFNEGDTPVVRLASCPIPGASGGGVFLNGSHIANNWSRSMGCVEANYDQTLHYSTAALNSVELLATIQ